jgi:hypothetical protein
VDQVACRTYRVGFSGGFPVDLVPLNVQGYLCVVGRLISSTGRRPVPDTVDETLARNFRLVVGYWILFALSTTQAQQFSLVPTRELQVPLARGKAVVTSIYMLSSLYSILCLFAVFIGALVLDLSSSWRWCPCLTYYAPSSAARC